MIRADGFGGAAAVGALVLGAAYAAVSAYWAAGGTALLATVGGVFQEWGHRGGFWIVALLWVVVLAKLVAAVLPMAARRGLHPGAIDRWVRRLAWVDGLLLGLYGLVLTAIGLAVQAGVLTAGAGADHRALAWHAYLWDPWFLLWGVLAIVALVARKSEETERAEGLY